MINSYRFASPPLGAPATCCALVIEGLIQYGIVEYVADNTVRFRVETSHQTPMIRKCHWLCMTVSMHGWNERVNDVKARREIYRKRRIHILCSHSIRGYKNTSQHEEPAYSYTHLNPFGFTNSIQIRSNSTIQVVIHGAVQRYHNQRLSKIMGAVVQNPIGSVGAFAKWIVVRSEPCGGQNSSGQHYGQNNYSDTMSFRRL